MSGAGCHRCDRGRVRAVGVRLVTAPIAGRWCFTALEFDVLWRLYGRDRLPYPLQFRGAAGTAAARRLARRDAARGIRSMLGDDLHEALSVLLAPAVRVEVCGFHGDGLGFVTRVHAGIRGDVGVVARQQPGADADSGGEVEISAMPHGRVAGSVVAAFPAVARGTGRGVASSVRSAESLLRPVGGRDEEELRRFFDRPRVGVGEIGVHPGPALDWRPTDDGAVVHWMDVADGRYLVRGGDAVEALPVSGEELATHLRALIAAAS